VPSTSAKDQRSLSRCRPRARFYLWAITVSGRRKHGSRPFRLFSFFGPWGLCAVFVRATRSSPRLDYSSLMAAANKAFCSRYWSPSRNFPPRDAHPHSRCHLRMPSRCARTSRCRFPHLRGQRFFRSPEWQANFASSTERQPLLASKEVGEVDRSVGLCDYGKFVAASGEAAARA